MPTLPLQWYALIALWLGWWISWWLAARWSSKPASRLPRADEVRHQVIRVAGAALLFVPLGQVSALTALYIPTGSVAWICVALAAVGFAFCWWARIHLGTLWSAAVTRKDGHRIVDSGPYGLVRHPIYTGIILAALATALLKGTGIAFAGAALFALSFHIKARLEEWFLREELGAEYDGYASRVPMLIPFLPTRKAHRQEPR